MLTSLVVQHEDSVSESDDAADDGSKKQHGHVGVSCLLKKGPGV